MSNSLLKKLPKEILRQNEIIKSDELRLHDNKIICLYFSASWCAPCKKFTPLLIDFYNEINSDNNHLLEIVFVSADVDEKSFQEYYSTMPWLAVPFKTEEIEELKDSYEIYGIPMLIVFNGEGNLIDKQGRELVEQQGLAAFDTWLMKA